MNQPLVDIFMKMVRIGSESGEEEEFILYLKDLFVKELKADCVIDPHGNLISRVGAKHTSVGESVLFGVHADTVKPGKKIEPVLKEGIIRPQGPTILAADDKAGIAELLEAVRTAERHPPLEIVVSVGEEVGHLGSKKLDGSSLRSKLGYVIDTEDIDQVVVGGPSHMRLNVDVIGRAAHAGMNPERGISSIKAAAYAISMLKEGWIDEETTVNIGIIRGGEILNAVPERTNVKIECRSQSHEKCLARSNLIEEVFLTAAKAAGGRAEVQMELGTTAFRVPEEARVVQVAKKAVISAGMKPKILTPCGGSDATSYNEKKIETIVIGTGGKAAHTTEEHIAVEDMIKAVSIIRHICEELS